MNYKEDLLWEKGGGTIGFSIPDTGIKEFHIDNEKKRDNINLPCFSEPEIVRHFTRLSTKNYGVDTGFYPLGSCTMKYNPKINEIVAGLKGFTGSHPLQGDEYSQGILEIIFRTGEFLKEITGMDDVTLQPAAGAHGELTSMLMFKKFHENSKVKRDVILIPDSAHGTNPASAVLCGFKTRTIKSSNEGIIEPETVSEAMDNSVAGLMITNPNTLGLFESNIKEICRIVHKSGGLVYVDGANLNAVMGIIKMGDSGVDAMHLNLHKTFSTPHGGGGPGSGAVCVSNKLSPYLPIPGIIKNPEGYKLSNNSPLSIGRVHGFYGHTSVIIKACSYILSMGPDNLKKVSEYAVLNANYIRAKLKDYYHLPYTKDSMHEVLFTDKNQKEDSVMTIDIAKRLIDFGFHPSTIYFPLIVSGAMLIEPTETESLSSLNNFINAMINIADECRSDKEKLLESPINTECRRVDETSAARHPVLRGDIVG